jgi:hypothetical protein
MNKMALIKLCALAGVLAAGLIAPSHARGVESGVIGTLDWERMRIDAKVSASLDMADIRLPSGRTRAEEMLSAYYFDKARGIINSIRLDSSTVIGDLVDSGEIPDSMIEALALQAKRHSPKYSLDFGTISSIYTIDLKDIGAKLPRHGQSLPPPRLVSSPAASDYSGIIIIAQEELPVHGRKVKAKLVPCLFPKIWDTEMSLVHDSGADSGAAFSTVLYTGEDSIFIDSPSGLDENLQKVVGDKPLRVIARGLFGINPTDAVIDRADALVILSSEANKRMLRDGRIAFIVQTDTLNQEL